MFPSAECGSSITNKSWYTGVKSGWIATTKSGCKVFIQLFHNTCSQAALSASFRYLAFCKVLSLCEYVQSFSRYLLALNKVIPPKHERTGTGPISDPPPILCPVLSSHAIKSCAVKLLSLMINARSSTSQDCLISRSWIGYTKVSGRRTVAKVS